MKTLIKNGQVLLGEGLLPRDILLDENEILQIAENINLDTDTDTDIDIIDASGLCVLPGLVDTHVHLREPGFEEKETIKTGSMAAAHGGFTTIFAMPNVHPYPSDIHSMEKYLQKIKEDAMVRVIPFGTITDDERGEKPTDYEALKTLGISWFSDDGVGVQSSKVMSDAMDQAEKAGVLFSCHTEDMNYRSPGACVHEGEALKNTGWIGIPSACESAQLIRDLDLLEEKKSTLAYHADHISAKESVAALAKARAAGVNCSGEVTAHHLLLEDKDVKGPNWKMNPPLRSHEDRMALIEGLESGALDFIANDHAPHTAQEKSRPIDKAPFGIVSLETSFPLLYTEFVSRQKRWSLGQLVNWMSTAPARRFGLEKTGEIKPGYRPDLVLVDLNQTDIIHPEDFLSKGKNTPFAGWQTDCRIMQTIAGGKTVYKYKQKQTLK